MLHLDPSSEQRVTSSKLIDFCGEIAKGMQHLEANRVIHRDLAARNVLVTEAMARVKLHAGPPISTC